MKPLYIGTEKDLIELSTTIPLDNPAETYSPEFYKILQFTYSRVDFMMKRLVLELKITPKKKIS